MIRPPEPASLLLLRDGLSLRAHIERMYPMLAHSEAWLAMMHAFDLALEDVQQRHDKHVEVLNERKTRDEG